ncbi:Non-specific lipid-transfer protein-like protein [Quillaja saponaria]|uniref:Non-specific lipid-transfer protein-like protein n=1 Tax=Quillaja saponaria TaxID=32244 RepID=A0AAD7Q0W2_QUISA|nr:Non-specific lipid-transfer protein-like protein [Quillaja saponaria]
MASRRIHMVLILFIVGAYLGVSVTMAQSSSTCTSVIISLSPCLNYITENTSTPSSGCCTQLATVIGSQPHCLCEVLNGGGSSLGLNINQTRALTLPPACKLQTPPISICNASSPTNSTPPGTSSSPSGAGNQNKTNPSTGSRSDSSNGNSTKLASFLLFFLLFTTSSNFYFTTV